MSTPSTRRRRTTPPVAQKGPVKKDPVKKDPVLEGRAQNVVRLRGRLAAAPERRTLPSGDEVLAFRLVVARRGARGSRAVVDTIDCTAWTAALRRRISTWRPDDILEIEGALRRRFWRSPQGARSRYDVEVLKASRTRADVPSGDE